MSPRLSDFDAVVQSAAKRGPHTVVVACGHDHAALSALAAAEEKGIARGILVGDPGLIGPALDAMPVRLKQCEIADAPDEESAVRRAVELVRKGEGQILLKGKTQTATLLHCVLDRDNGLRTGHLLSDAFLFELPTKDGKRLVCITDGGINLAPDLSAKRQILENAVRLYHRLGYARPRVACLSAVETVVAGHGPSQDAAALARMAHGGQISDCEVEGPLSLDLSISPEAVAKKGHQGEVAGRADILLCPEIISANLLAKSTTYFAHYRLGHVIMGASAPILIPSRSDTADAKMLSIALGALTLRN
jgi:phosphate butyryltransferase